MEKLTKQQIIEINKQVQFKKQELLVWLENTSKWDNFNAINVPLAKAKEEIAHAIDKEFNMGIPWVENSHELEFKKERDKLVDWINNTFIIRGKNHFPIQGVVKRVEGAMEWFNK